MIGYVHSHSVHYARNQQMKVGIHVCIRLMYTLYGITIKNMSLKKSQGFVLYKIGNL